MRKPRPRKAPHRKPPNRKPYVRWSPEVADGVCEGLAMGIPLRHLGACPDLPSAQQVRAWMRTKPGFAERVRAARREGGIDRPGTRGRYDEATVDAVTERLARGEPLYVIAQDPALPCLMTLYNWLHRRPGFARDIVLARQVQAETAADAGWELALSATPRTARDMDRLLRGIRARAESKLPRKAW